MNLQCCVRNYNESYRAYMSALKHGGGCSPKDYGLAIQKKRKKKRK